MRDPLTPDERARAIEFIERWEFMASTAKMVDPNLLLCFRLARIGLDATEPGKGESP